MPTCTVCDHREIASPTELATQVCQICAKATGIRPLPPSRRPPAPCQRCNKLAFVRAVPRTFDDDRYTPIAATFKDIRVRYPALGGVHVEAQNAGRGVLELYICQGCGF